MNNTKARSMKLTSKHNKEIEKEKMQGRGLNRVQARRERKIALQQDVDKLKKKLRHEENVHRALERAFTRPLGALPRLPPYLPSHTLELLAEVAVLEEEVVRLEEQVVTFRQGLYEEAVYILSYSEKTKENQSHIGLDRCSSQNSNQMRWSSNEDSKKSNADDHRGKENQICSTTTKKSKQTPAKSAPRTKMHVVSDIQRFRSISDGPNKLSEDMVKCLLNIFSRIGSPKNLIEEPESSPSVSGSRDPYGICSEFGPRDIGPYKNFVSIEGIANDPNVVMASSSRRLKFLLGKLAIIELRGLTQQQKLAFWINIYNSCMMNAYLENGIPATPQMVVSLMPKAMINVGGHSISAMTIEHFILRLPYHSKNTYSKEMKNGEMAKTQTRGTLALDWPEPLVTFALSCGSWSSPAVRIYTATEVEKQLETAKRDYLQAAIGILKPNRMSIPKLLDWYLLDFAKDVESLVDWICLQLPTKLRNEAMLCLDTGRKSAVKQPIQVLPYEFRFRYLLAL